MEEEFYNPYRLFRIPELSPQFQTTGQNKNKVIIGLIDCSGSMGSFWKDMVKFWNQSIAEQANILITFSQHAKLQEHPYLDEDIKKHGGGMTNILDAFKMLEKRLELIPQNSSVTIVFISDGEDTVNGENKLKKEMQKLKGGLGKDITFLCLGIKSGFPTFISMQLRKLYHTGDQKIPAVYLIQYASEKAFFNKFETMSQCFKIKNKISVPDAGQYCKEYPWEEPGKLVFQQNKWIMVHKQFKKMTIIYNQKHQISYEVTPIQAIPLEDLVECFRGWVQKVQFLSLDNKKMQETKKIAAVAAKTMRQFTKEFEQLMQIYIISEKPVQVKQSFKARVMNLAIRNTGSRVKWFLDELDIIAKGSGIGQLSEFEAAKRMAIGTITGKYHQKALALKGITVKDFQVIKEQFVDVFKTVKLSEKPSLQQPSIFTLQNQKQVFQEEDFLEGLNFCKTQFDLVETLPIVGFGLKIKRYDGSMINPWKVRVQSLAKHHKTIDSMYLAKNSNKYELSVGNDEVEEINAVLPLFDLEDSQMSDIFNTKLFKLAVSFMVVQNIDTYHDQAYLALLGSTFVYLLRQPASEWRSQLIDKIYTSVKVTYGATQQFKKFIKQVEENPFNLFKAKSMEDHVDIVKVMLVAFYIWKEGVLEKQKALHLIDLALVHYAQKTYVENEFKILRVAEMKLNLDKLKNQENHHHFKDINVIKNENELKSIAEKQVKKILGESALEIELSEKIFRHQDQEKRVIYPHVDRFYEYFNGKRLEKNETLFYFGHYLAGKNEQNYKSPVKKDFEFVKKICSTQVNPKDLAVGDGKKVKKIRRVIENQYVQHFRETHFGILPISKQKLIQICQKDGYKFDDYNLNEGTGLLRNTCMSPHCLYYMKKMTTNEVHDHLRLWRGQVPARFHMNVVNQLKNKIPPEQICENLLKAGLVREKKHRKGKQFIIDYIVAIAKSL